MIKAEIDVKQKVELVEYWVLRGIVDTGTRKEVAAERVFYSNPTPTDVAQFLFDNPHVDFVSVENNYKLGEKKA